MSPTLLALLAAASAAISALFTKRMVGEYPARQLIGPLLGLNALLVTPFLPFVHWHFSWTIVLLHLASAATLVLSSWCIFELFVHGSASAVAVGQAMAPIPAVIFTALLLSTSVTWTQAIAATIVSFSVLAAIGSSFGELRASHAIGLVAVAASMNGLLVVLTKLLTDRGLGVAEIYVVRTSIGAAVWISLALPRDIPLRALPAAARPLELPDRLLRPGHPRRAAGQPRRRPDPGGDDPADADRLDLPRAQAHPPAPADLRELRGRGRGGADRAVAGTSDRDGRRKVGDGRPAGRGRGDAPHRVGDDRRGAGLGVHPGRDREVHAAVGPRTVIESRGSWPIAAGAMWPVNSASNQVRPPLIAV